MKLVRESISFERGKDPRHSMTVGLAAQVGEYLKENGVSDYEAVATIQDDEDIPLEIKKEWIKHLLNKDPEKYTFEDPELYWFDENNFDYLDALQDGYSRHLYLPLEKLDGTFYVSFDDMSELADLFNTHSRDISKEFIEKILSGDSWDIFEWQFNANETKEYIVDHWDKIKATDYLTDLYQYREGKGDTPKEIIDDIFRDSDYDDLEEAIQDSLNEAYTNSAESEAYNHILKGVTEHFGMEKPEWDETRNVYFSPMTKEGANKLFRASLIGEDKFEYYEPYGGYDAGVKPEEYSDILLPRLEHLP